jgi:hypothetical protein
VPALAATVLVAQQPGLVAVIGDLEIQPTVVAVVISTSLKPSDAFAVRPLVALAICDRPFCTPGKTPGLAAGFYRVTVALSVGLSNWKTRKTLENQ